MFGRASVRQTMVRFKNFKEPKSRPTRRTIALPGVLIDELKHLQGLQTGYRRILGREYIHYDLVFCQPTGKPHHGHNITQSDFRAVIKRAKVPTCALTISGTPAPRCSSAKASIPKSSRNA